jgi:hypothetical protein
MVEAISDGLGDRSASGGLYQGVLGPGLQRYDEGLYLFLSHYPALVGGLAADLGFDLVKFGNIRQSASAAGVAGDVSTTNHRYVVALSGLYAHADGGTTVGCHCPGSRLSRVASLHRCAGSSM